MLNVKQSEGKNIYIICRTKLENNIDETKGFRSKAVFNFIPIFLDFLQHAVQH